MWQPLQYRSMISMVGSLFSIYLVSFKEITPFQAKNFSFLAQAAPGSKRETYTVQEKPSYGKGRANLALPRRYDMLCQRIT
jgi:hypothetical protein